MTRRRSRKSDQHGQTTLMIVGFAGVLFMLLAVVVDASAAYLQRQGLATIADGAALAGADAGATGRRSTRAASPTTVGRDRVPRRRRRRSRRTSPTSTPTAATRGSPSRRGSPTAASRCWSPPRSTSRCSCPAVRATPR
ncbi:pilus assembly protein TadG-related protein [Nocardioides zeae]